MSPTQQFAAAAFLYAFVVGYFACRIVDWVRRL